MAVVVTDDGLLVGSVVGECVGLLMGAVTGDLVGLIVVVTQSLGFT